MVATVVPVYGADNIVLDKEDPGRAPPLPNQSYPMWALKKNM